MYDGETEEGNEEAPNGELRTPAEEAIKLLISRRDDRRDVRRNG